METATSLPSGSIARARRRSWVTGAAELLRTLFIAPVGIGMPLFMLLLFVKVPQMPGLLAATSDGYREAGTGLPRYDDAWWHQIGLPIAVTVLSFQCWFWTRAALNAAAGEPDAARIDLPLPERWASRLLLFANAALGLSPVWAPWLDEANRFNFGWLHTVPWAGIAMASVCWMILFTVIRRRRHTERFRRNMVRQRWTLPHALTPRLFAAAPGGWPAAASLLLLAVLAILTVQLAPDRVERRLHTVTGALLGASCYVALATVVLTAFRDLFRWMLERGAELDRATAIRYGGRLGFLLFLALPFMGSYAAAGVSLYDVPVRPDDGSWRRTAAETRSAHSCETPVIVAAAGGASRAAAWEMAVLHALDVASQGEFSRCLSAISSVSGGSLGAVTYALARAQNQLGTPPSAATDRFRDATVALARYDMIPVVAFNLFSVDLLFGLPSRGLALSSAFEDYWSHWSGLGLNRPSFRQVSDGVGSPVLALNGVDVRTGARLITTNMSFEDGDHLIHVADGYDVLKHIGGTSGSGIVSAADAVLNSARFPIMSPPGVMSHSGDENWSVVDGGVYEASGVATAVELAAMLHPGAKPLLVVISNDGTPWSTTSSRGHLVEQQAFDPCTASAADQPVSKPKVLDASGQLPVPEILTSLAGLYQTRTTRYLAELARARSLFCDGGAGRSRLLMFELPSPSPSSGRSAVPMNWALSESDCEFMLGDGIGWAPNLAHLQRAAGLLGKTPPTGFADRLKADATACRGGNRSG